jgi:hypothetical protein
MGFQRRGFCLRLATARRTLADARAAAFGTSSSVFGTGLFFEAILPGIILYLGIRVHVAFGAALRIARVVTCLEILALT